VNAGLAPAPGPDDEDAPAVGVAPRAGAETVLADGAGAPLDQGVATVLFLAGAFLAWVAFVRLRGRAYLRMPRAAGWAAGALAVGLVAAGLVLPPIIRPDTPPARPSSSARLRILSPRPGEAFTGSPASVPVRLRLIGGRVVPFTSARLVPNEGHIHLFLDGNLVSMTFALGATLRVAPGVHRLEAEFVALDHAPFAPRVTSTIRFRVAG
jgi:hypothetical protein